MEKLTEIQCDGCYSLFMKPTKEVTRRTKNGKKMYCTMSCYGIHAAVKNIDKNYCTSAANIEHLRNNRQKGIGFAKHYADEDVVFAQYIRRAKHRRKSEINETISWQYLKQIWRDQEGLCAITKIPLIHNADNNNEKASLDRIDSSLGYIEGNVQFISCTMNYAKSNSTDQCAHDLISLILLHYAAHNKMKELNK